MRNFTLIGTFFLCFFTKNNLEKRESETMGYRNYDVEKIEN